MSLSARVRYYKIKHAHGKYNFSIILYYECFIFQGNHLCRQMVILICLNYVSHVETILHCKHCNLLHLSLWKRILLNKNAHTHIPIYIRGIPL